MKDAVVLRTTLSEMGHAQPPTPIQVDNSTACGIANTNIKLQRSKAIDMRFYWVRDRVDQQQFTVFWKPGKTNLADYVTEHHTGKHYQLMGPIYLHMANYMHQIRHIQASLIQTHCKGVLIPRLPRDHSPARLASGRLTGAPDILACMPFCKPITTFCSPQQANLTCRLII